MEVDISGRAVYVGSYAICTLEGLQTECIPGREPLALYEKPALMQALSNFCMISSIKAKTLKPDTKWEPDAIFVRNEEFASALAPLANVLSISFLSRKNLGSIEMLKESMMSYMAGEGQGRRGRK